MLNSNNLPTSISQYIAGKLYTTDEIGRSAAAVCLFDDCVLKTEPHRKENEHAVSMMRWLEGKIPAPRVIAFESDGVTDWLLMTRIKGEMACDPSRLKQRYDETVMLLAEALKILWCVDISDCPRFRGPDEALAEAEENVGNDLVDTEDAEPDTFGENGFSDPQALLRWLKENKPPFEPVLSHGDFCLPNVMLTGNKVSGYIDLVHTAASDKWNDIALCYRSLRHNLDGTYGTPPYPDCDPDLLFEKLGIVPDHEKLRWYTLLDELF